jgi:hypothetical protein
VHICTHVIFEPKSEDEYFSSRLNCMLQCNRLLL